MKMETIDGDWWMTMIRIMILVIIIIVVVVVLLLIIITPPPPPPSQLCLWYRVQKVARSTASLSIFSSLQAKAIWDLDVVQHLSNVWHDSVLSGPLSAPGMTRISWSSRHECANNRINRMRQPPTAGPMVGRCPGESGQKNTGSVILPRSCREYYR